MESPVLMIAVISSAWALASSYGRVSHYAYFTFSPGGRQPGACQDMFRFRGHTLPQVAAKNHSLFSQNLPRGGLRSGRVCPQIRTHAMVSVEQVHLLAAVGGKVELESGGRVLASFRALFGEEIRPRRMAWSGTGVDGSRTHRRPLLATAHRF
jgi:hypothetical protein